MKRTPHLTLLKTIDRGWQSCSIRERRLITLAFSVIILAALYALGDWIHRERDRLNRAVPRAEAQLAQLQEAAIELRNLRAQTGLSELPAGTSLVSTLTASASSRGLALSIRAGSEGFRVNGHASFDALISWLGTLQQDYGLRVRHAEIARGDGNVSVDLTLVAPSGR